MKVISKEQYRQGIESGKIQLIDNKDNHLINGKYFKLTINKDEQVELEQYEVFNEGN